MKKIFASLFVLVFLYTLVGYYPVFLFQQNNIKKEIKERIKQSVPEGELQIIVENQSNFSRINWVDKNEFLFEGNLFDVVRIEKNQMGETVYFCINDRQENRLFSNLEKLIQNAFDGKTNNNKNLVRHLVKDYIPNSSPKLFVLPIQDIQFAFFAEKKETEYVGILSPPPRIS